MAVDVANRNVVVRIVVVNRARPLPESQRHGWEAETPTKGKNTFVLFCEEIHECQQRKDVSKVTNREDILNSGVGTGKQCRATKEPRLQKPFLFTVPHL